MFQIYLLFFQQSLFQQRQSFLANNLKKPLFDIFCRSPGHMQRYNESVTLPMIYCPSHLGSIMEQEIEVVVQDPKEMKSTFSNYFIFTVRYKDRAGTGEVFKRYSDFDALRNSLLVRWPGVVVPALPPKKTIGVDDAFIIERCCMLSQFCREVAARPHFWYGEEFQIFLRENEVEKKLSALPKPSLSVVLQKYKTAFEYVKGKEINTDTSVKLLEFGGFLNKNLQMMDGYRENIQNMIKLHEADNKDEVSVLAVLLPDFQATILAKCEGKPIVSDEAGGKITALVEQLRMKISPAHWQQLYFSLSAEAKQMEALDCAIKGRKALEAKRVELQAKKKSLTDELGSVGGGGSFFNKLFKGSPEEEKRKLQAVIELNKSQIVAVDEIVNISTVLLTAYEIDIFKRTRVESYFKTLRKIAEAEAELARAKHEVFTELLQHSQLSA